MSEHDTQQDARQDAFDDFASHALAKRMQQEEEDAERELQEGDVLMDHPPMTEVEMP